MKTDFQNSTNQALKDKAGSIVDFGGNTDWFEEITRQALSHVHNLSISGGNEKTNYYASVNYRNLQGMVKRSYNDILNGRLSLAHLGMNDKLKFEMTLANTFRKSRPTDYGVYRQAMQRNPTLPVYNEDGTYREESGWELFNPVAQIYQNENDQQRNELMANVRGTLEIVKDLKFSVMGAIQKYNDLMGSYAYRNSFASIQGGYSGEASRSSGQSVDRTLESVITYNKYFGGKHSLSLMAGYSYQDFMWESFGARNRYFITDALTYNNLGSGLHLQDGTFKDGDIWSNKNSSKLIAFFGRAIYSYDDKYMFTLSARREGASRFGINHKWGLFPSVTAGWRLSRENFMSGITWLSDLKLRIGYGITGNQGIFKEDGSPLNYASLERLAPAGMMLYNGKWIKGYGPDSNPNPDLRWEKKAETNFGIDIGVLDNRVIANVDFYQRSTTDLIFDYAVPVPPNLFNKMWTNVGKIKNQGVEITINAIPVKSTKFSWNTNFNISYNKNKLVSLSNDLYKTEYTDFENIGAPGLNTTPAYRLEEGSPIGNMFGYVFAGFTEDGKWLFWDKDHQNKLPASEIKYEDKKVIGNGLPKYWMGFTNTFNYANFDLTVFLRGTFGFDLLNTQRIFFENRYMVPVNILKDALDSPVVADPQFSDYYVEKGDYIKLDNVTLGYTIPFKNKYIQKARVYLLPKI
ncbi:MAG: SusC/RagA family TonB-linked outer membrane protein [Bacteroidales bacterium]|nr:SusC/RagA family TonB-linked outer membrane protein [Bacteroidales bacterium]